MCQFTPTCKEMWRSTHHIDTFVQKEWLFFQDRDEARSATNKKIEASPPLKKMYQCDACGYTTPNSNLVLQHKAEVHKMGNNKFVCEICPFICKTQASLANHKNWRHTDDKKYECDLCPYTSSIKKNLQRHVKTVHKKTCVIEAMRKFQKTN